VYVVVASVFAAFDAPSAAVLFTGSADVVFSVGASAADGRATVIVTGFGRTVFLVSSRAGAAAASVDAMTADDATAMGDATGFGSAISCGNGSAFGGSLVLATSVCCDGRPIVISTAAAMTQIAPANTARGVSGLFAIDATLAGTAGTPAASVFIRAGLFGRIVGRIDRIAFLAFLAFFAGTDILLSESFWSFRSAESSYRIDRGGLDRLFTRTDILLGETRWNSEVSEEQMECPCRIRNRAPVTRRRNAGCPSNR
jgi:hypothetical protein